jgi:hypothetical protein
MKKILNSALCLLIGLSVWAQAPQYQTEPQRFDYGKMWTFENPPKAWFEEAYDFKPADEWYDDVRKSALRFASWCSAAFVSPNGLIMTNHHCSRSVVVDLQNEGENFDDNGFYAKTLEDERKADGLFVEQLLQVADITDMVKQYTGDAESQMDKSRLLDSALASIEEMYSKMEGWEGLRLQVVTYYSGGRYSLYGYKKFEDIRLVMIPELALGFYGGDPDNFTYPRYNLDVTFWRAYDENGQPLNTADNYYAFNPDGISDGEPVFIVGNPGRTERYRTISELSYDRDYRYKTQLQWLKNRYDRLYAQYEENPNQQLLNQIFSLSNSIKAYTGIVGGLNNPVLFNRKVKMEQEIRANSKINGEDPWKQLETSYAELSKHAASVQLLNVRNPMNGKVLPLMFKMGNYYDELKSGKKSKDLESEADAIKSDIVGIQSEDEKELLALLLMELKDGMHPDNNYMKDVLEGQTVSAFVDDFYNESALFDEKKLNKLLKCKAKKWDKSDDPAVRMARVFKGQFEKASSLFQTTAQQRRAWDEQVANYVFQVKGTDLPPDATFTLRLADGVVKGYEYNGTIAPIYTTYFGLYNRHYSHQQEEPWNLPEKWSNPGMDLLKSPINFVSTNDIIGGNSGSSVINRNAEVVGLVFDGNIESLPGNFIYDDTYNRSVSVHAGGITAALEYVYKAERLLKELLNK